MKTKLTGKTLRWVVCLILRDAERAMTVQEIVAELDKKYVVPGRAGKAVSDCLRWEVGRGRVVQVERGRYARGFIPRSTEYGLRKRVEGLAVSLVATTAAPVAAAIDSGWPEDEPVNIFTEDGAVNLDVLCPNGGIDDD